MECGGLLALSEAEGPPLSYAGTCSGAVPGETQSFGEVEASFDLKRREQAPALHINRKNA